MVTFQDPDFDPGFATSLPRGERHILQISVFSYNADTATTFLVAEASYESKKATMQLPRCDKKE